MNIEKVNINEVKKNPENPRIIKDGNFKKLVNSIKEFPEMLQIRPIVVDENNIVLGGNMRLKACKEAGLEEVFIIKADQLTEEQKKEFIVKDNVGYGEWDWNVLKTEWNPDKLNEWGLVIPEISPLNLDREKNQKIQSPEDIVILNIELNDLEKQKELFNKLIKLGYPENKIKLLSFTIDKRNNEIITDTSKIEKVGKILKFNIDRINECKISYNVKFILDKFDMKEINKQNFTGEINLDFDWNVGLIVGNSGTGKSTIAKELFGENYITNYIYDDKAIVDNFGDKDINDIINTLSSVGLASTPNWVKPYHVLSGGEKMRCDLAKALLSNDELIVFDEFTSVVDRDVAKVGSFVTQKNIRKNNKKFIAVSCHFDVEDWLLPDWVFNTNTMEFFIKKKSIDQILNLNLENLQQQKKNQKYGEFLESIIF